MDYGRRTVIIESKASKEVDSLRLRSLGEEAWCPRSSSSRARHTGGSSGDRLRHREPRTDGEAGEAGQRR